MKPEMFCDRCHESILPGEGINLSGRWLHQECSMRMVIGGLNHLRGVCTCCGGTENPDPPGLSKRDAARFAMGFWLDRPNYRRKT